MASVKVLLYKSKKKADGRLPIVVRVIKDRKPKYIYLDWIEEKHWDEKNKKVKSSHPNSARLNNLILKKLTETDDLVLESEALKKDYTAGHITKMIKKNRKGISFFQLAEEYLEDLRKEGQHTRASSDSGKINRFKKFLNGESISFQEIDEPLLKKFKGYMISTHGVQERTIMNAYVVIRTLFNRAIKEGVVDSKYYPFGKHKVRIKFPQTFKIGLNEDELIGMENVSLAEGTPIWHARNVFLFSFYLAGIRVSDVLRMKWSDIKDERIFYKMGKNSKVDSLKLPGKILSFLEYYEKDKQGVDDFIFPELKKADLKNSKDIFTKIRTADKKLNYYLKQIAELAEIKKDVTMHIARHSFGNIAGDKISPHMLQKLYRHTSLNTTIGYQRNFLFKDADEALDAVVNFQKIPKE